MAREVKVGVLVTGDSKGAVKAIKLTEDQVESLNKTVAKSSSSYSKFTSSIVSGFSGANKAVDGISRSFQGLGALITGLGLGTLFKSVLDNTVAQEKVTKQLETVIASTGGAAGRTSEQMIAYAKSLQATTTYGDEAIEGSQALLATFTDIKDVNFDRTTKAILDMSTAMGQDLKSSTIQLGKALNDPIANLSALSRVGIQFSDAQKDLIKSLTATGEKAEAQKIILTELEREFGGSAAAARDTLGGALTALGNSWDDLLEVEQSATGPMKESIESLNAALNDPQLKEAFQIIAAGLLSVGEAAAKALPDVVSFAQWIGEEIAVRVHGIAADDIPRLEQSYAELAKTLKNLENSHGRTNYDKRIAETRAEMAKLKTQLDAAYAAQERNRKGTEKHAEATKEQGNKVKETTKAVSALTKAMEETGLTLEQYTRQTLRDFHDRQRDANRTIEEANKILDGMVSKAHDYAMELAFQASLIGKTEREQAILNAVWKAGGGASAALTEEIRKNAGALYDNKKALEEAKDATKEMEDAWNSSRDVLSDFFFEFASDGLDAFDTLVEGFKAMLAKMIAEAAANQIILGIGAVAGSMGFSGAAAAANVAGTGGTGLFGLAGLSSFGPSAADFFMQNSSLFTNQGLQYAVPGSGGVNLTPQFSWLNAAQGLAGGFAGGYLGNQAFGDTSGVGQLLGAFGGSLIPGVGPFVGPLLGAFGGSGLERVLGNVFGFGGNGGNQAGRANLNLSTGAFNAFGVGNSFDQANVDTATQLAQTLQLFSNLIGGSTADFGIKVGNRSGLAFNGQNFGQDVEAFFDAAFQAILNSATNLREGLKSLIDGFDGTYEQVLQFTAAVISMDNLTRLNSVNEAIKDFNQQQPTLWEAYSTQTDQLKTLIANFDGSAYAADELNTALIANKAAAYDLAIAIQTASASITDAAQAQSTAIKESILSTEDLFNKREFERDLLRLNIPTLTDPAEIEAKSRQALDLNQWLFDQLPDEAQIAHAFDFAGIAEEIGSAAADRFGESLGVLQDTQDQINGDISTMLQDAATKQQQAANTMERAVGNFQTTVNQLQTNGIRVVVSANGSEVNA